MSAAYETRNFIEGAWRAGETRFEVLDKYRLEPIAEVSTASSGDVDRAVATCRAAFRCGVPSPYQRSVILRKAADILRAERDEFVALYQAETGFTGADAAAEVSRTIETFALSGEEARRFDANETVPISGAPGPEGRFAYVMRVPIGPVAAITPFNAPLNTVAHKVAPAIAAGNPILLKPSGHTPLCGARLIELVLRAGWPDGLAACLQGGGEVGQALLANPDIAFFTFTGSTEVGRTIQSAAGLRRTQLELGSIAFTILEADADLDKALPLVRGAAFRKAGQVCTSVQVLLAQEAIAEEVTARMTELTRDTPCGDPAKEGTLTGPMISLEAARRAEARVASAVEGGAHILAGGTREGAVMAPTLLSGAAPDTPVLCEEMFAPVMTVLPYGTLDEAVGRVNATPYGLASGLFTARIDTAFAAARALEVGTLHINNSSSARVDLMPYGGMKDSGFGREGPAYAMREMTEERLITFTP